MLHVLELWEEAALLIKAREMNLEKLLTLQLQLKECVFLQTFLQPKTITTGRLVSSKQWSRSNNARDNNSGDAGSGTGNDGGNSDQESIKKRSGKKSNLTKPANRDGM